MGEKVWKKIKQKPDNVKYGKNDTTSFEKNRKK